MGVEMANVKTRLQVVVFRSRMFSCPELLQLAFVASRQISQAQAMCTADNQPEVEIRRQGLTLSVIAQL